jgi:hypothetical protein
MTQTHVVHSTEDITPELAQKYLDRNKLNRDVKDWRVKLLVADMLANNFPENGEAGVTFDWNNNIAGGQHTLTAVVRSGRTIRMRVTRGVDPAARSTMNDSLKQRFRDDLTISGVGRAGHAEPLLRKVVVWETVAKANKGQGGLNTWRTTRFSRAQLSQAWPTYAAGITATLENTAPWHDLWKEVGNRGAMQLFYWVLTEKHGFHTEVVNDFLGKVVYGSSDEADRDLFQKLRRRLRLESSAEEQVFWLIRVWNAWLGSEHLARLMSPIGGITDPYPKLRIPR